MIVLAKGSITQPDALAPYEMRWTRCRLSSRAS
jgi:hypothetical protein